jgi:hypothetical protein
MVHPNAEFFSPGRLSTHTQKTCHNPLIIDGIPVFGTMSEKGGGTKEVNFPMIALIVGIITPGWVKKITKNVSVYP